MSTEEKAEDARAKIMDAAAKLIAGQGSQATSVGDVIQMAGVSKGAFYHHFASKEDLILAVFDAKDALWFSISQPAMEVAEPLDRLVAMVRSGVDAYEGDPDPRCFMRLLVELVDGPSGDEKVIAPLKRYVGYLIEDVKAAQQGGAVDSGLDPDMVAWFIVSGFTGIEGISYQLTGGADLRQRIDGWIDLFLRAVAPREAA